MLTIFPAAPASAAWVHSRTTCIQRGGAGTNNHFTDVCVRLQRNTVSNQIRGYGALDADSTSTRVFVRALHLDRCSISGGTCTTLEAAAAKGDWGYVNQVTRERTYQCGFTYQTALNYDIRFPNGVLVQGPTLFTDRLQFC